MAFGYENFLNEKAVEAKEKKVIFCLLFQIKCLSLPT